MAAPNHSEKLLKLTKYAELLKQRLKGTVPQKHAHRPQVFKDMVELDLKKTLAKMEKIK